MGICHPSLVFSHRRPLLGHPARQISRVPLATMLCRTLPSPLPILGIRPPSLTQILTINRRTINLPFICHINMIRMVSGGTRGSTRAHNTCINNPTTCRTSLNSNICPPNLINNSSYSRVLLQTPSCDPLALPSHNLGLRRLDLNRNPPPRVPRYHNRLPRDRTRRSNRRHHVRNRSASRTTQTHLPKGRNG